MRGKNIIFVVVVNFCSFLGTFAKWETFCSIHTQQTRVFVSSRFLISCSHSFEIPFLDLALNFFSLTHSFSFSHSHTHTHYCSFPLYLSIFLFRTIISDSLNWDCNKNNKLTNDKNENKKKTNHVINQMSTNCKCHS